MNEAKHNDDNNVDAIQTEDCLDSDRLKYVCDIHNNKLVTSSSDETLSMSDQRLNTRLDLKAARERERIRRSHFTEEQRALKNAGKRRRCALIRKEKPALEAERVRRALLTEERRKLIDVQLSEKNRVQRYVCRNDEQLLELKLGKLRAKQLNDHMLYSVKRHVNSHNTDWLSEACTESCIVSEAKHIVDNNIDFETIINDNNISNIRVFESISELNEMTDLNIKQENEVYNSVVFKAYGEHIEKILPIIGQKQINTDECEGNSCDKNITNYKQNSKININDLLNRIIRRKLLIERNLKFLISMCDGMGIKEIESLNVRQRVRCDDIYDCFWPQCNASFISNISLMDHLKLSHHKESEVTNCNNNYNNEKIYAYMCRKCGQKFKNVDNLYDHVVMHIDKPFMCDFCENRFDLINELLCHRDYVHFKRKFNCDQCEYRAKTIVYLRNHKSNVHKKQFICNESECNGISFSSKHDLNCHQISVHSDKRCECFWPECGATFKHDSSLAAHLKKHCGQTQYSCGFSECAGKTFSTPFLLDTHMRSVHSQERPFVCDWPDCNAKFKIKHSLKMHIKGVHKKQAILKPNYKVIKCLHCDYESFSKQGAYFHNKRVHEKVMKFICDVLECNGKSFFTKRELDDHKNSVHSDKRPFVCDWPQCNSTFKLKQSLRIHVKRVHTPENKIK